MITETGKQFVIKIVEMDCELQMNNVMIIIKTQEMDAVRFVY